MCLSSTEWTKKIPKDEPIVAWKAMRPTYEDKYEAPVMGELYVLGKEYTSDGGPGFHAFEEESSARLYCGPGETVRKVFIWGAVSKGLQPMQALIAGSFKHTYKLAYAAECMRMV